MIDGKYYVDGECFCKCLSHAKGFDGKDMVWVEACDFSEYGVSKYDKLFWIEESCDRRFVESTEEEYNTVRNLIQNTINIIDKYNDKCFLPRWAERKKKENENMSLMEMNSHYSNYTSDVPKGEKED